MRGLVCAALALVAAGRGAARAEDCADTGVGELGAGLIEHSCFHTTNGPFAQVTATPGTTATAATPNIDAVHTNFTVAIDPAQPNVVTYAPARAGTWAIFGDTGVPHTLVDAGGQPVPVRLVHGVAGCAALPVVRVYSLAAGTRYTLRLGPVAGGPAAAATRVVVEKVSDFETQHGRDEDGDGHGGDADTVLTPCVPPAGYVRGVDDCDDADPSVHPGAAERCNGGDDDCDGLGDEGACLVGGGGCSGAPRGAAPPGAALLLAALGSLLAARVLRRRGPR